MRWSGLTRLRESSWLAARVRPALLPVLRTSGENSVGSLAYQKRTVPGGRRACGREGVFGAGLLAGTVAVVGARGCRRGGGGVGAVDPRSAAI